LSKDLEKKMRVNKTATILWALSSLGVSAANADVSVVASIKPVHSLVSSIMQGVGSPTVIIEGAGSPHTYSLKPSQAKQLQDADLVFWMGDELETFLEGPIQNIAKNAKSIKLIDSHGLKKIKFREGGMFEEHDDHDDHDDHDKEKHAKDDHDDHGHDKHAKDDHDDHGHDKHAKDDHDDHGHDKHAKDDHDDHGHDKHAKDDHDDHGHDKHAKDDHDDHGHGEFDPHVWLDPINAKAIVHEIEEALVKADPKNAKKYEANAVRMAGKLDQLVTELRVQLQPVQGKGFIVFHDAYQYFEQRFGVAAIGSITVSPEVIPGAERVKDLREKIRDLRATCVFSEPQFEPKLVRTIVDGTDAQTGILDPLGSSLAKGPDLYFELVREMARSLKECLSAKG
jgi:zinc transport system substrate-binding protein